MSRRPSAAALKAARRVHEPLEQEQLATYLNLLFGGEPEGAYIEARFRVPRRGGMAQRFESVRPASGFLAWLTRLGNVTDVYLGVAPRRERRGCRDAVERAHVAWADIDSRESIEALASFEPRPSLVVVSGSGRHAYWSLWPAAGADAIERANRRLAHALGADLKATDAARVLRPPGTLNFKSDPARPVRIVGLEPDPPLYELGEVAGHLPDPTAPRARERAPRPRDDDDVIAALRRIPPVDYIEALVGQAVGRDGKIACPFHQDRTPSLHAYDDPEAGWTCFGSCEPQPGAHHLGGDVFTFGAKLWDLDVRENFPELRDRLAERLLGGAK